MGKEELRVGSERFFFFYYGCFGVGCCCFSYQGNSVTLNATFFFVCLFGGLLVDPSVT